MFLNRTAKPKIKDLSTAKKMCPFAFYSALLVTAMKLYAKKKQ